MNRPNSMKRAAIVLMLLSAALGARQMANPSVRRPVVQFIHFYQQSEDMSVWERVIYSLLLTRSTEPAS
jgi:hypothetical protein